MQYPAVARLVSFRTHPQIVVTGENADGTLNAVWGDNSQSGDPNIPAFREGAAICRDLSLAEVKLS